MRPSLPSLSAASNAILKPGGLLRWKVRLVKDARLLLPLTEVMKIARLTSPLLDVPRQSSPTPRLRHGRRLALLFYPNLALNLYTLFFVLSWFFFLVFLFYSNCSSPSESASVYAIYLRSQLFRFSAKGHASRVRGYLSEIRRATCSEESHSSFSSPFSPAEFLAAASNLSSSTATGPHEVAYCSDISVPSQLLKIIN